MFMKILNMFNQIIILELYIFMKMLKNQIQTTIKNDYDQEKALELKKIALEFSMFTRRLKKFWNIWITASTYKVKVQKTTIGDM